MTIARLPASASAAERDRQAGLTLVETLVTVAIVAVMAGMVTLGAGRFGLAGGARDEAARLAAVLDATSDAALASGRDRLLHWSPDGYGIDEQAPHRLPPGMTLARQDQTARPVLLSANGTGGAAILLLQDSRNVWAVAFDGLRARVVDADAGEVAVR